MTCRTAVATALLGAALAASATAPAPAGAAVRGLDLVADVRMLDGGGSDLRQRGRFAGAPFGRGSVDARTIVGRGRGAIMRFTLRTGRGTVRGSGDCKVTFRGDQVLYDGIAKITAGTGAYRRARASRLRFSGRGDVSGERFRVHLTGRVRL